MTVCPQKYLPPAQHLAEHILTGGMLGGGSFYLLLAVFCEWDECGCAWQFTMFVLVVLGF